MLEPEKQLQSGILEEYHDKYFDDFYGHPDKIDIFKKKVEEFKRRNPGKDIKTDFDKIEESYEKIALYKDNLPNAKKHGINLLLYGPNGTGKSMLGISVLKKAIKDGYTAQFTSLSGIISLYSGGWYEEKKQRQYNKRVRDVDFLMIDDIGKEYKAKSNDLTEVIFDNLIRYRSFRRKPIIMTTNIPVEKIESTYGQSIVSLLSGKTHQVELDGSDFRKLVQSKQVTRKLREG